MSFRFMERRSHGYTASCQSPAGMISNLEDWKFRAQTVLGDGSKHAEIEALNPGLKVLQPKHKVMVPDRATASVAPATGGTGTAGAPPTASGVIASSARTGTATHLSTDVGPSIPLRTGAPARSGSFD